jgi:hypothetical protein
MALRLHIVNRNPGRSAHSQYFMPVPESDRVVRKELNTW